MAPAYQRAAKFLEPEVRLGKVNAEEEPSVGFVAKVLWDARNA